MDPFAELLEGSIYVSRNPGNKEIGVDVVRLEKGPWLEIYALREGLFSPAGATFIDVMQITGKVIFINDFLENLTSGDNLCIALKNRGNQTVELREGADFTILGTFDEYSDVFHILDQNENKTIGPAFGSLMDLGTISDLDGSARIAFTNGEELIFVWDPEVLAEDSPVNKETETVMDNNSGGCFLSGLLPAYLVLLVPLLLLGKTR